MLWPYTSLRTQVLVEPEEVVSLLVHRRLFLCMMRSAALSLRVREGVSVNLCELLGVLSVREGMLVN